MIANLLSTQLQTVQDTAPVEAGSLVETVCRAMHCKTQLTAFQIIHVSFEEPSCKINK